jgi:hypothetical protein
MRAQSFSGNGKLYKTADAVTDFLSEYSTDYRKISLDLIKS